MMTTSLPALNSLRTTWLAWIVLIVALGSVALWADQAHRFSQDRNGVRTRARKRWHAFRVGAA